MSELPPQNASLPPLLRAFCWISVLLTGGALTALAVCRYVLGWRKYPYGLYGFPADQAFSDLWGYGARFRLIHSPAFFSPGGDVFAYPPALAPVYEFFFLFPHSSTVFLLVSGALALFLALLLARGLARHEVASRTALLFTATSLVFSYPFYFEFARANVEIVVWFLCAAGLYAVLRERPWLGGLLIGLATAMKLFPFIYFGLMVSRRQYRQVFAGLAAAAAFTLASLWLICPNLSESLAGSRRGMASFNTVYLGHYRSMEIGVDHSLFAVVKRSLGVLPGSEYAHLLNVYVLSAAALGIVLYLLRIRRMPAISQVLCLAVACCMLPPTAYDYTLLHLYTPWVLCVLLAVDAYRARRLRIPGLAAIFVLFALLMSQLGEIIWNGERLGGQLKAIGLLVLFVLALWYPLPSRWDKSSRWDMPNEWDKSGRGDEPGRWDEPDALSLSPRSGSPREQPASPL